MGIVRRRTSGDAAVVDIPLMMSPSACISTGNRAVARVIELHRFPRTGEILRRSQYGPEFDQFCDRAGIRGGKLPVVLGPGQPLGDGAQLGGQRGHLGMCGPLVGPGLLQLGAHPEQFPAQLLHLGVAVSQPLLRRTP
jgi:hypothetical protein